MLAALAALALTATPVEAEIARALREAAPGAARAVAATRPLVGTPYLPSPLGEGEGRDKDPRFRLDAFDCMTFVETAVALASASSLDEARMSLDDIRYDLAPTFAARNHEVVSQWIPSNARKGWIVEATAAIAGSAARPATKEYTVASWQMIRAAGRAIPGVPLADLPLGRFTVGIVPPGEASALAGRIPEGAIIFVVRADAPDRATRVTHAGLAVHGARGEALIRHATSTPKVGRVIEEPIERFLRREARAFPRWPLEGLAFFTIADSTARVRALASAGPPHSATDPPPASPAPRL